MIKSKVNLLNSEFCLSNSFVFNTLSLNSHGKEAIGCLIDTFDYY